MLKLYLFLKLSLLNILIYNYNIYIYVDDDFLLPLLDSDSDLYNTNYNDKQHQPRSHINIKEEEHEQESSVATGAAGGRGTKKRKRDFVQGLMDKCNRLEEENAMMRVAVQNSQMSLNELEQRREEKLKVLRDVIEAFNEGDIQKVSSVIKRTFSTTCVLVTPSIFQELNGYFAIVKFFTVLIEAFPDALLQIVDPKGEHNGVVSSKFNFSGTKVFGLPTDVLFRQWSSSQKPDDIGVKTENVNNSNNTVGSGGTTGTSGGKTATGVVVADNMNPYAVMEATNAHNEEIRSRTATGENTKQPVVKLAGHITVVFDSVGLICRFIFVWNTTSLIGQVCIGLVVFMCV